MEFFSVLYPKATFIWHIQRGENTEKEREREMKKKESGKDKSKMYIKIFLVFCSVHFEMSAVALAARERRKMARMELQTILGCF